MINPLDLSGRTFLVTGASSGIGRETAILLSELGATVILVARNEARLEQTRAMMGAGHHQIAAFDLNRTDEIPSWIKSVAQQSGMIDGIVHSAGATLTLPVRLLKTAAFDDLMRINVTAAMSLTRGLRQAGVHREKASIVFLSSVMGLVGQPGISAYSASKGALEAMCRSLAVELAPEGIRVNCVAPAHVQTEMADDLKSMLTAAQLADIEKYHPLGIGTARDVAHAIAFLLADTGRWITGTTLIVDGGYTAH